MEHHAAIWYNKYLSQVCIDKKIKMGDNSSNGNRLKKTSKQ